MKSRVKDLELKITDMIDNFIAYDYRKHAFEELEEMEKLTNKYFPNIAFIIEQYPDFNSLMFKITDPNHWRIEICINPEDFKMEEKKKKKAIRKLAKMINSWFSWGTLTEEKN